MLLYELYKKTHSLNAKQKRRLHDDLEEIIASILRKKKRKTKIQIRKNEDKEEDRTGMFEEVSASNKEKIITASGIHDPETVEDMIDLVSQMKRFIEIDGNVSYDNVSIFLHPLFSGSKKIVLRPCKVVGLVKRLQRISREFNRNENSEKEIIDQIRKDFFDTIVKIQDRINAFIESQERRKKRSQAIRNWKVAQNQQDFDVGSVVENIVNLMKHEGGNWTTDDIKRLLQSGSFTIPGEFIEIALQLIEEELQPR